jgi:hypothetical protein
MEQPGDVDVHAPLELGRDGDLLLGRMVMGREVIDFVRRNALDHRAHLIRSLQIDWILRRVVEQVARHRPDVQAEDGAIFGEPLKKEAAVLTRAPDDDRPPHADG